MPIASFTLSLSLIGGSWEGIIFSMNLILYLYIGKIIFLFIKLKRYFENVFFKKKRERGQHDSLVKDTPQPMRVNDFPKKQQTQNGN